MRCFYHPAAEAVGTCKNCARGLCAECAGTRAGSLACPNRCETAVDALDKLIAGNIRASRVSAYAIGVPIFFLASGLAILIYSRSIAAPEARELSFVLGAFITLFALLRGYAVWRFSMQRR